jgi:hypothetical protein
VRLGQAVETVKAGVVPVLLILASRVAEPCHKQPIRLFAVAHTPSHGNYITPALIEQ